MMTREDYELVTRLVRRNSGLSLGPHQDYLVESRLEELSQRLGTSPNRVLDRVRRSDPSMESLVAQAITVNETSFFRDRAVWERLRSQHLPALLAGKAALRVWSAACSTGQEPYSLAMLWEESFAASSLELLATDLCEGVLERARQAHYNPTEMSRGLTPVERERFFHGGALVGSCRSRVEFRLANLIDPQLRLGLFDLILCRNVLIYFDAATRNAVLATLRRHLAPGGRLLIGASEVLTGQSLFRLQDGLYLPC